MTNEGNSVKSEPSRLRGIVLPIQWGHNGKVERIALNTHDEKEYVIDFSGQGKSLLNHLQKMIEVDGKVFQTIVLKGEITHKDSMGNGGVIRAGEVQRMSAGTGLTHSEFNKSGRDLHFYQIWVLPDMAGLPPSYEQKEFKENDFRNVLFPLASGQNHAGAVRFHTDAAIYRSQLDAHRLLTQGFYEQLSKLPLTNVR